MAASGKFDSETLVARSFPLDDVNEACQMLRDGAIVGCAVINMS